MVYRGTESDWRRQVGRAAMTLYLAFWNGDGDLIPEWSAGNADGSTIDRLVRAWTLGMMVERITELDLKILGIVDFRFCFYEVRE